MEEKNKTRKNHWTSTNIDNATKKINQEIYKRKRQAPLQIKIDDLAIFINVKITRRGIAKGMVFVQEDLNKNILLAKKETMEIFSIVNPEEQCKKIESIKRIMKIELWTDIRFLMIVEFGDTSQIQLYAIFLNFSKNNLTFFLILYIICMDK